MNFFNEEKIKYIIEGGKILLLIATLMLIIYSVFIKEEPKTDNEIALTTQTAEKKVVSQTKEEKKNIRVDLKGAVKKPGVYTLVEGSIIDDLIKQAGGASKNATFKNINLSKKLEDEMVIYVYTTKELEKINAQKEIPQSCSVATENISECEGSSIITTNKNSQTQNKTSQNTTQGKISINNATLEQLTSISGIGESKAQAIIDYRNQNGPFKSIEDILNVSGIGESLYQKIKDSITL